MKVLAIRYGANRSYYIKAADNDPYRALADEVIETAAANGRAFRYGVIAFERISASDVLTNAHENLTSINSHPAVRRHAFKRLWEEASKIGK